MLCCYFSILMLARVVFGSSFFSLICSRPLIAWKRERNKRGRKMMIRSTLWLFFNNTMTYKLHWKISTLWVLFLFTVETFSNRLVTVHSFSISNPAAVHLANYCVSMIYIWLNFLKFIIFRNSQSLPHFKLFIVWAPRNLLNKSNHSEEKWGVVVFSILQ